MTEPKPGLLKPSVARVNSVVFLHGEGELRLGEIQAATGLAQAVVQSALDTLISGTIVSRIQTRTDKTLYAANPASPYYQIAHALALVDLPLADHFTDDDLAKIRRVWVGNKTAQPANGGAELDLVVLTDGERDVAHRAVMELGYRYGRTSAPLVIDRNHALYFEAELLFGGAIQVAMRPAYRGTKASRRRSLRKSIAPSLRFRIYLRDGFRCVYCGRTSAEATLVLDDVVPIVKGGIPGEDNFVTSCAVCNEGKGVSEVL